MSFSKAFICGCSGLVLSAAEQEFIARERPWGLILFSRNIAQPIQVKALVAEFRNILGQPRAPVLVDQEGGRVQRLGPPHWPRHPSAAALAALPGGRELRNAAVRLGARLIGAELRQLGVNVDCMPVLDVSQPEGHSVIGDRAYSRDPEEVAALGSAALEGLLAAGVLPIVKHIPGHGRARADSHRDLPVVGADLASLRAVDFAPFRALRHAPIAMTAHIVYTAIDPERAVTVSAKAIEETIRGDIGFDGLLLSDDLSMHALRGSLADRACAAFAAGIDVGLHCNGDLAEAAQVAAASPRLEGRALARAEAALALVSHEPGEFDLVDARAQLHSMLAMSP